MEEEIGLSKIYRKLVIIANKVYNLAITPEIYNDQTWLKNNECFRGIFNTEGEGNIVFEMELKYTDNSINQNAKPSINNEFILPDSPVKSWIIYPANLDPAIVVELVKMTNKFHNPTFI